MSDSATVQRLRLILDSGDEEMDSLRGKFHAHLTLAVRAEQIDECREYCRAERVKFTAVDLANVSGRQQTDLMITCHFRDPAKGAVKRITSELAELTERVQSNGWPITRAKLEHESLPSLQVFDASRYHEVHIKLSIPAGQYQCDYEKLLKLGATSGFVPSRNPLQRDSDTVTQFANLRIYQGGHQAADNRVNMITSTLEQEGFKIVEVKRETVVFDTAQHLDAWWA